MFQEFRQWMRDSDECHSVAELAADNPKKVHLKEHCSRDENYCSNSEWNLYAVKLSRALCSFLLPPEDVELDARPISSAQTSIPVSLAYWEVSAKWTIKVLFAVFPCIKACSTENELPNHLRIFANVLQKHILYAFRKLLLSAPGLLDALREEGMWDFVFSEIFSTLWDVIDKPEIVSFSENCLDRQQRDSVDIFHLEVISFVEFAATLNMNKHNMPECSSLLDALEQSACNPQIASILLRSLHRILQLAFEQTVASFRAEEHRKLGKLITEDEFDIGSIDSTDRQISDAIETSKIWLSCMEASLELFTEFLLSADDGKSLVMHNALCIECLFDLFWVESLRSRILGHILSLLKMPPSSPEDHMGKLQLCSKYLETFTRAKEREKCFAALSIDLLVGMRDVISTDRMYYQTLFCEGECFLHIVSLLNGSLDEETGEQLVLNVLGTLTSLLCGNVVSKVVFRALVGVGYQMLQSLLLDFFQSHPSMKLLNALLDMLNEDVILLFLNVLQKSSNSLQHYGLDIFQKLLREAGMLSLLLDWFRHEEHGDMIIMIAQLIQIIGGHSVTGKDIRKIFALLRNEKIRSKQNCCTLLLNSIGTMLREKGPTAFFEFNGFDSASDGRALFNASSGSDHILNKNLFEATVMDGTQICSRRMLQEIIYCVGGVSVFFPLLAQLGIPEAANEEQDLEEKDEKDKLAADVLELITSMHLLQGFSILGFLLQSVSPHWLNVHTFLSLKRMLDVLRNSGNSELVKDAISWIYLNPHVWVFAEFKVLQKRGQVQFNKVDNSRYSSHFILPHILVLIFKYLARCEDCSSREKILRDLLDLIDSNPLILKWLASIRGDCEFYITEFQSTREPKDIAFAIGEILNAEGVDQLPRIAWNNKPFSGVDDTLDVGWWNLYDNIWAIISEMSGKASNKMFSKRARGLVESLNIPATEMAAVVTGGIGGAFGGRPSKNIDKAMLLRNEKCPRIVFHLVLLYLFRASPEKASTCVQQFCALLPTFLSSEEEQLKNRIHLFLWSLINLRSQYETLGDGARVNATTQLIFEIVNCGKSVLAGSISGMDDTFDALNNLKESSSVLNLLQRTEFLLKYASNFSVADEITYVKASTLIEKVLEDEVVMNLSGILASDDSRRAAYQLAYDEKQQITAERWIHMLRSLIDERGPWSANPFPNDSVTRWKLDKTEDDLRRRPKLRRNYHFDDTLCLPPAINQLQNSHSAMESYTDSGVIPDQMKSFLRKGIHGITEQGSSETGDDANESGHIRSGTDASIDINESKIEESNHLNTHDVTNPTSSVADAETDEVLLSIPCVLVTLKRKLAGRLAVMRNALHFFSEFLVEDLGIVLQNQCKKIKRHRRWNICKVKAVHWSRYLLQYTALEIFFNDSVAPVFLNFASSSDAKDVGTLIVSSRNESLVPKGSSRGKSGLISFVDRRIAVEMAETARESWRRREISNFEYLMILNTLAGRSYNDLTQYPIFPWVLADYSSEKLDFNKSSTFRDLSKPVGALDFKSTNVFSILNNMAVLCVGFDDRYHNFCDPDIPSFYYGSHYSSMGIVLFYLLRLEPFTALHRALQGGKFDHADRLFQSIEGTYRNCLSNTSDNFLVNSNSYHIGVKQDGEPLGDVSLPPWAKGSPEEFIYNNREALESEFVSSNLHHWIDLIFGYKQRGRPAVEAANVFYYLTYEGAVDLETMDDELQRSAIEDQIANFGQTPIQLFRKKHPRRGPPIPIAHPLYFAPASITLTSIVSPTAQLQSPVLFLGLLDSNIVVVNKGLTLSVKMWLTTQLQSGGNFTFSSAQDPFFGIGSDVLSPHKIGTSLAENFQNGRQCFATVRRHTENYLISCGNWENSFQVISLHDGRTVQSVRQHKDVVSCVSVTSDGSILATGSYDTTVMLWNVFRGRSNEKRVWTAQTQFPQKDQVIDESPFHILCGHDDIITCLFVSTELDIVISGSKDATCVFHTLRDGRYVRSIQHPSGCALSRLVASQSGRVVIYAEDDLSLHLYSVNGKKLASSESNGRLNCIELSSCGEFLVCAGDHGQIVLRSMHSLEVVQRYEGIGKVLTSLVVTPEECFLAGSKDGSLLVYSIENPQIRKITFYRARSRERFQQDDFIEPWKEDFTIGISLTVHCSQLLAIFVLMLIKNRPYSVGTLVL
ncbi:unnamed protein product [Spirodela intermedia]|uniref:Uncharacterized protein n=1 Tax=Spirodela intermedia TaxID=51605 RepID=A0A7I8IJY2_SPIIN|nr:unnamed protein product [Spirodela intermedia]CAA6657804.1 unnamed protein product [Spirodela intermedia]